MFEVFVRNWWRRSGKRLVPDPTARKHRIARVETEEEARQLCKEYNRTHSPGPLSRKAEFGEIE